MTTLLDILDTAVKIGLGTFISAISGYAVLRKTQKHEKELKKSEHINKLQEHKRSLYINYSTQSDLMLEKYQSSTMATTDVDFLDYLRAYNELQILCSDDIRVVSTSVYNLVIAYSGANKLTGNEELHGEILLEARNAIRGFQKIVQLDCLSAF